MPSLSPIRAICRGGKSRFVEAFERKHTELVTISRLLLDSDIDLLKTKQRLDLVGDLNSSCLSVASRRLNDALEARVRSERIKAMPFGNDTTRQMMLTVRDFSTFKPYNQNLADVVIGDIECLHFGLRIFRSKS